MSSTMMLVKSRVWPVPEASENTDVVFQEDIDDEAHRDLSRDINKAEEDESYPQGRPGSLLNRLISHGNKKTEDEIASGSGAGAQPTGLTKENAQPGISTGTQPGTALSDSTKRES
jgi:hypothetical protein